MDMQELIPKLEACPTLEEAITQYAAEITEAGNTEEGLDALDAFFARKIDKKPIREANTTASVISARVFGERQRLRIPDKPIDGVNESDGEPVKVLKNELFENWGGTVNKIFPSYTFVPRTREGVVNIVKFATKEDLRVRCSGARHSWSDIYGRSGEVLISMMPLDAAEPRPGKLPTSNPQDTELESVELVSAKKDGSAASLRIGASATADHVLNWLLSRDGGDWRWMIAALPVFVEVTSAGWTQPICHGAGIGHPMVSDIVTEMEFVNVKGEIQKVSDTTQLRAAAGAFGMCGVLLSQTVTVKRMRLANFFPRDVNTVLAIPPPTREDVPEQDDFSVADFTDEDLAKAKEEFARDVNKFYSEWFWFPFQRDCWVNCWDTSPFNPDKDERPEYLSRKEIKRMELESGAADVIGKTALRLVPPLLQAKAFGALTMAVLPDGEPIPASVCDALHFRRGIHKIEVLEFEAEIEVPRLPNGELDFLVVQKAWWKAINAVYREKRRGKAPMRTTLEMRMIGGSEVYLAPQYGNEVTCAIEVLTNPITNRREWEAFIQSLMDEWSTLKNSVTGEALRVLPHWAKQWPKKVNGRDTIPALRELYKHNAIEFKKQLTEISEAGGYTIEDMLKRFGNDNMLDIIDMPNLKSTGGRRGMGCCMS